MNNYIYFFLIVISLNYFITNVLAENYYYIVSIRRNKNDKYYDKATILDQYAIDELVNDRMNDIYDLIFEYKWTYILKNGKDDEKLKEFKTSTLLRKRDGIMNNKIFKFRFINKNRQNTQFNKYRRSLNETTTTTSSSSNENEIEYIPFESELVSHVCPVLNYYVVRVYLSDEVAEKVKKLPNVIDCQKIVNGVDAYVIDNNNGDDGDGDGDDISDNYTNIDNNNKYKYYNEKDILEETKWKGMEVQENEFDFDLRFSHLSLISQGKYSDDNTTIYDNNYYYPSTAGKGINIYVMDSGLDTSISPEDFDEYKGTPDERTISCDFYVNDGEKIDVPESNKYKCDSYDRNSKHGTIVSISAVGKINGVAKKANLHVMASSLGVDNDILSFDLIKQNSPPYKTIITISHIIYMYCKPLEDKVKEMVNAGYIIIVSAGNDSSDACSYTYYPGFKDVISVGAINNKSLKVNNTMESVYKYANYSNYGRCVFIYAPGTVRITNYPSDEGLIKKSGTSFSSPMVAGLAATIMADQSEINFDTELMKKALIDLSLKDAISDLKDDSFNRIANNGKHSIYQPHRCDDPSNQYACKNGCCSKYGHCVDPKTEFSKSKSLCLLENNCQSEFGQCFNEF